MTVHGAKGLQAPIVILPDTVRTPTQRGAFLDQEGDSPLWSPPQALDIPLTKALKEKARAKEMDEYWRLLYVALTRAEDHLYVCGWTPKSVTSKETWYGVLQETLEKMAESQRLAFGSQTTMPCLVYETNPMQEGAPTNPKPERESPVEDLPPWVLKPIQKQEKPFKWANPSQGVPSKQTRKSFNTTANPEGQSEYLALRGTLIHKLLETIPDTYDLSQMRTVQQNSELITDIRGFLSLPLQGLTADQIDEIQAHTLRVLDSSAFQALLGSGSFAEIPVVGVHKETAYSGQIDRLVEKDQEVWLIDYKTNQSPPSSLEGVPDAYIQQLKIYAVLVESLYPSKTIRPFLFWTETLELMEV